MFWQRSRGVKLSSSLSPLKFIWYSSMLSSRWGILRRVTKWKIGLSGFTKPGWGWCSDFTLYRTPLVWALVQEKADSCNMHPDVIANLEATNKRNKRKYVPEKKVDVIVTRWKRQRNLGRFEAMQYSDRNKDKTLTLSTLFFSNDKGPTGGEKADSTDDECHCQKE